MQSLCFTARQRLALSIERQIPEADIIHRAQPQQNRFPWGHRTRFLDLGFIKPFEISKCFRNGHVHDIDESLAIQRDIAGKRRHARSIARRTRLVAPKACQLNPACKLVIFRLQHFKIAHHPVIGRFAEFDEFLLLWRQFVKWHIGRNLLSLAKPDELYFSAVRARRPKRNDGIVFDAQILANDAIPVDTAHRPESRTHRACAECRIGVKILGPQCRVNRAAIPAGKTPVKPQCHNFIGLYDIDLQATVANSEPFFECLGQTSVDADFGSERHAIDEHRKCPHIQEFFDIPLGQIDVHQRPRRDDCRLGARGAPCRRRKRRHEAREHCRDDDPVDPQWKTSRGNQPPVNVCAPPPSGAAPPPPGPGPCPRYPAAPRPPRA